MSRHVVITGIGVIAPNALGKQAYLDAMLLGRSGIRRITQVDTTGFASRVGGEVESIPVPEGVDAGRFERIGRWAKFAVVASRLAVDDARLTVDTASRGRVGVCLGTSLGGSAVAESQAGAVRASKRRRGNPLVAYMGMPVSTAVLEVARALGTEGPQLAVSNGCISSHFAIAQGCDWIRDGRADTMLVGGSEAPFSEVVLSSYSDLKQMTCRNDDPEHASRPFDRDRDGFVLSEGGAVLVLEDEERARARGATIYARVLSCGMSQGALGCIDSAVSDEGVVAAMDDALGRACVPREEVDWICAQGSSGKIADRKESSAIRSAFGRRAYKIPVSSVKALIGHALGAAGAFQAAATALAVWHGTVPATWNYEHQDPECDLDYVPNGGRRQAIRHALVNAFAVGGSSTTLAFGAAA